MDVYTVLFNTVMDNDIEALKKRVDSFPDFEVNAIVDGMGRSLLCGAISKSNTKMIRYLIELGADLEHESLNGKCPLHWTHTVETLNTLVTAGVNINKTDENGETLLTKSISQQNISIVLKCLQNDANIEGDVLDATYKPLVSPFIKATATPNCNEVIQLLANRGANPNVTDEDGMSALLFSLQTMQEFKIIHHLLDVGANIKHANKKGENAFFFSLKSQQKDVVEFFLDQDFDVNYLSASGEFPLKCAAKNKSLGEMISRKLIDRGAHVNLACENDGITAIHIAACIGNTAVLAVLVENNANVNAMTAMGRTPLMYAAEQGNMNCVLLLLDHGANHVLGDKRNRTAIEYCNNGEIQYLLQRPYSTKRRRSVNVNQP